MSCFWDSINKALGNGWNPEKLLMWFKEINTHTHTITINGRFLTAKEKQENFEWIKDYKLQDGHLTSTSDPFLALLAHVQKCNIIHRSPHAKIMYSTTAKGSAPTFVFNSSNTHITFQRCE